MKWITRERPKTDRIACPWLIKNFIDPEAEFLYVPTDQVLEVAELEDAHSYDAPNAEYTHRDGLCSFEVLIEEYKLDDLALQLLARIVHGADVADDRDATPQSRGLLAVAEGFHLLNLGDHRQLELSLPVYDALYAWCKQEVASSSGEACTYLYALPAELPGVAGVLIDEEHDLLFSSDRDAARVSVFRCSDEQLLGQVEVGPHPNGLAYDRRRRRLYSFNLGEPLGENCTSSLVDLDSMRVIGELPLPGRPRWAVYDEERDVVYANIREPAEIVVIDCEQALIVRALPVPSAGPHGLWLDSGRLFCAADGGALVVLGRDGREVIASLPLPGVPDVVMHDPDSRRLYVAIGEPGLVCSFDSERLEQLETVETEPGAHTTCWDRTDRCLYVFCPASGGAAVYEERA